MVKQDRNIHCTVCGKTYSNPVAAQNHARGHNVGTEQALVTAAPRVQPTTGPAVAASRTPRRFKANRNKLSCPWCPEKSFRTKMNAKWHRKTYHPMIYQCSKCPAKLGKKGMWKHMRDKHGATDRRGTLSGLRRTQENTTNHKKQPIPDDPSTVFPDEEESFSSEDDEGLSSGDREHILEHEGQSSFEVEQRPTPELVQDHRQSFSCDLCPDSFLTVETLTMHTKFVHRWKCGYCKDLVPLTSVSLWREHRTTVHGLVE